MFAVLGRFNRPYEEAATDLGANDWQRFRDVILPIILPGVIGVACSASRSLRRVRPFGADGRSGEHLPLEIWAMTTAVTSPTLFAVGTVTTIVSFVVIAVALGSIADHPAPAGRRRHAYGVTTMAPAGPRQAARLSSSASPSASLTPRRSTDLA